MTVEVHIKGMILVSPGVFVPAPRPLFKNSYVS